MGFIRLVVFGFVALSVIYFSVSIYSRSVRREKLEKAYDNAPVEGMTRTAYVERGMAEYQAGLRPKLLLLIYVLPVLAVGAIIYYTNAN